MTEIEAGEAFANLQPKLLEYIRLEREQGREPFNIGMLKKMFRVSDLNVKLVPKWSDNDLYRENNKGKGLYD